MIIEDKLISGLYRPAKGKPLSMEPVDSGSRTVGAQKPVMGASFVILVPIFNDWSAAQRLLNQLDQEFEAKRLRALIVVVSDGSLEGMPSKFPTFCPRTFGQIEIVFLRRNLGHQRAIAIGLAHIAENFAGLPVVIIDGDGEDSPSDVPRLYETMLNTNERKIVFAERTLRSEGKIFQFFYLCYRALHVLFVGAGIRFGNFSIVPPSILHQLVVISELWNHYAAAVCKARLPYTTIRTQRAKRICGQTKMDFYALVVHGLSALSINSELIGVRVIMATLATSIAVFLGFSIALIAQVLGWLSLPIGFYFFGALLTLCFLAGVGIAALFILQILHNRTQAAFVPIRDFKIFIGRTQCVFRAEENSELALFKREA